MGLWLPNTGSGAACHRIRTEMQSQCGRLCEISYHQLSQFRSNRSDFEIDEEFLESTNLSSISWMYYVRFDISRDERHYIVTLQELGAVYGQVRLCIFSVHKSRRNPA